MRSVLGIIFPGSTTVADMNEEGVGDATILLHGSCQILESGTSDQVYAALAKRNTRIGGIVTRVGEEEESSLILQNGSFALKSAKAREVIRGSPSYDYEAQNDPTEPRSSDVWRIHGAKLNQNKSLIMLLIAADSLSWVRESGCEIAEMGQTFCDLVVNTGHPTDERKIALDM
ncbi:hypothetical protein R1flu_023295 [Riccia fluitans]|uniref:Uncharacterized protein n=1 Tax=Riccia fluitans TaxID=41844 RepID=A0ABD1XRM5_9MARC